MLIKNCLYLKIDILIFLINKSKMCSSYSAKKKKKSVVVIILTPLKKKKNHTPMVHHRNPQKSSVNSTHCKENIPRV